MKHETEFSSSARYHYIKWKHHCLRFIAALALLSNCIVWSIVAAMFGATWLVAVLSVLAVLTLIWSVSEASKCDTHHTRYMRSTCNGFTTHPTNQ